jgi:hypothetical protein
VCAAQDALLREADERRASNPLPPADGPPDALITFFLSCPAEDMDFFIAAARSRILGRDGPAVATGASGTPAAPPMGPFFSALDAAIGTERFLPKPDEDRLGELEGLREYVVRVLVAQDAVRTGARALDRTGFPVVTPRLASDR